MPAARRFTFHPRPRTLLWLLCLLAGCSRLASTRSAEPPPDSAAIRQVQGGADIVIQRPTPGWVRLSLWIDVGARDADPPQLATAAGLWAARHAGATARTLPDGTELYLNCDLEAERLARCVRRLANALAPPAPAQADVAPLLRRLREDRRRQTAAPGHGLERAALETLLGDSARGLSPLGDPADDARVSASAIAQFVRAHYGPNRAVLIGAGDLDKAALQNWSRGLAPAARGRTRRAPVRAHDMVRILPGDRDSAVLALLAPGVDPAARVGQTFADHYPHARARAFPLRGAALLLLRLPLGEHPFQRLHQAAFEALRLTRELDLLPDAPPARDDLVSLTRRTGEAWVSLENTPATRAPWPMAAVLSMVAAAPVGPSAEGAASKALADAQEKAEEALERASAQLEPKLRGDAEPGYASVRLRNGIRIEVQRRPHDARFAASVQIEGGAALDPAGRHGRAALLATLAASACAAASAPALTEQLRHDRSRMRPLVAPARWGVLAYGDSARWRAGVDRLLQCVLAPSFRARDIEDARVRLLDRLRGDGATKLAWSAAHTLLPSAPGGLAPWGSPRGIAAVHERELRALHRRLRRHGGVVVRLRVPADAREAAAFAARRLAGVPAPRKPEPAHALAVPPPGPLRAMQSDEVLSPRLWVGFAHAPGEARVGPALSAAAAQVAHRLNALPGYQALGIAGDSGPVSWIWLELRVDPESLHDAPAAVRAAARAVRSDVPDAIERSVRERRSRLAAESSDPVWALRAAFHEAAPIDVDEAEDHVRALLKEPPRFVVLRPLETP